MLINLTGDRGLILYDLAPRSLKSGFVQIFKSNPKAILGLTKAHFVIHSIKVLDKYNLTALIIPFTAFALGLNLLPEYLTWAVFIGSLGYLVFLASKRSKASNPNPATERR